MTPLATQAFNDPEIKQALKNIEAWGLSARFTKSSLSIYAQNGLLLIQLHTKPQILFFAAEMGQISIPDASPMLPDEPACTTIARLESSLASERASRLKLAQDAETLQARITELRRQLKNRHPTAPTWEKRYANLKNFLARELHPDYFRGPASEQKHRTEIFKLIWSKVEEIDKS